MTKQEKKKTVVDLLYQGKTLKEISEQTGLSYRQVQYVWEQLSSVEKYQIEKNKKTS